MVPVPELESATELESILEQALAALPEIEPALAPGPMPVPRSKSVARLASAVTQDPVLEATLAALSVSAPELQPARAPALELPFSPLIILKDFLFPIHILYGLLDFTVCENLPFNHF